MIVASLLLIVAAVGLLVLGLFRGADGYLVASIAASLLASVALVIGGRRHMARRLLAGGDREPGYPPVGADPADEPPVQPTTLGDAARIARSSAVVFVIAGRPRYHRADCTHLDNRSGHSLSAREAVERGFTPCALCEPDTVLLAQLARAGDNRV